MLDSGTKLPENRIHLYDPVGLITDGYSGYRGSNYAVRPRRPTKSYDDFAAQTNKSAGLMSFDSFTDTNSTVGGLRSYDNFTDTNSGGLRSYDTDSFSLDISGGGIGSYDHTKQQQQQQPPPPSKTPPVLVSAPYDPNTLDTNGGGLRFRIETMVEDNESDASTPRLWKPSSPTSPKAMGSPQNSTSAKPVNSLPSRPTSAKSVTSPPSNPTDPKSVNSSPLNPNPKSIGSPLHPNHSHHHSMSPSSRTEAIAKGRKELMDMVRDLPESFYELSLKDIVEKKPEHQKQIELSEEKKPIKETARPKETNKKQKKISSKKVKKSESKKKMVRSRSVDNGGFLLKTSVFPIFAGLRKNKKRLATNSSFKIAPIPKPQPPQTGSVKGAEKDWWRRKSCISSESDESNGLSSTNTSSTSSSSSSSRSNSSNGRSGNRFIPSCCLFNGRRVRGRK